MSSSSEKACSLHRKACAVRNEKGAQFERNLQHLYNVLVVIIYSLNLLDILLRNHIRLVQDIDDILNIPSVKL